MTTVNSPSGNAYTRITEEIFNQHYRPGDTSVPFERREIEDTARRLGIGVPKNLGDLVYSIRYRMPMPSSIVARAAPDREWAILPAGRSVYEFRQVRFSEIKPNQQLARTDIPDATPGSISMYALSDEQALLATVRYNRLIDIFTGLTCYSLQNHLRTSVSTWNPIRQREDSTQVETDELYIGIDKHGQHYAVPVEAKSGSDSLNVVQIWQNTLVCRSKLAGLPIRCVAVQSISDSAIALIELQASDIDNIAVVEEKHYQLVAPDES